VLDERTLSRVHAITKGQKMLHKTMKATATASDLGEFEALVSTSATDREGESIQHGAFGASIEKWRKSGKVVPLHWDHGSDPEDIVGYVDPFAMREERRGLVVAGKVDLDTDRGRQVWRLMRANSIGFSFGFLMDDARTRSDGVREIRSVDVFEISVTPRPANDGTRVLDLKSIDERPSYEELRRWSEELGVLPRDAAAFDRGALGAQPTTYTKAADTRPLRVASFEC
jgi:uncharacterized protein